MAKFNVNKFNDFDKFIAWVSADDFDDSYARNYAEDYGCNTKYPQPPTCKTCVMAQWSIECGVKRNNAWASIERIMIDNEAAHDYIPWQKYAVGVYDRLKDVEFTKAEFINRMIEWSKENV